MDLDSGIIAALTLGLLLGLKHATDADHVVAVSTIAREFGSAWRGIWVGASWGLGHSTPLLILGVVILLLKDAVLDGYADAAPMLEFGVGVMLVLLGAQVFWNLKRGRLHVHAHGHDHGQAEHLHIHASHPIGSEPIKHAALEPTPRSGVALACYSRPAAHRVARPSLHSGPSRISSGWSTVSQAAPQ